MGEKSSQTCWICHRRLDKGEPHIEYEEHTVCESCFDARIDIYKKGVSVNVVSKVPKECRDLER